MSNVSNPDDVSFIPTASPIPNETQEGLDPYESVNYEDVSSISTAYDGTPEAFEERQRRRAKRFHKRKVGGKHVHVVVPPTPKISANDLDNLLHDHDDYYTNPLVSATPDTSDITQLLSLLDTTNSTSFNAKSFATATEVPTIPPIQPVTLPSLLRPDVSNQHNKTFPSDPYSVPGKVVKIGRIYVENVDIAQNSNWSGNIDFHEEGRLMGFTITCNDPDIVVTCFIENSSGTRDVINDMSFKDAVIHGRGMTYGEAISTFKTPQGVVSRDVSGQPSSVFPYVKRYKDQYTGSGVYKDIKNTPDDKAYVMVFEPTTSIPYQRLNFSVFNGSTLGSRMINRLEIKRLIYVDPDPAPPDTIINTDIGNFSSAVQRLSNAIQGIPQSAAQVTNPIPTQPQQQQKRSPAASPSSTTVQSHFANEQYDNNPMASLYNDFIRFMYSKINENNKVRVNLNDQSVKTVGYDEQRKLNNLMRMVSEDDSPRKNISRTEGNVLKMRWD